MLARGERGELRGNRGALDREGCAAVADVKCCGLRAKRFHASDLTNGASRENRTGISPRAHSSNTRAEPQSITAPQRPAANMVLLTMTPPIVAAVRRCEAIADAGQMRKLQSAGEPQLTDPAPGKPISHAQLIGISDFLKARANQKNDGNDEAAAALTSLNELLRGSRIHVPPPPPKPEPVCTTNLQRCFHVLTLCRRATSTKSSWLTSAVKKKPAPTNV